MKKIYIYGIGVLGQLLYYELLDRKITIDGIIVSDGYRKSNKFLDIKIYELREISLSENDSIYLTTINNKNKIIDTLRYKFGSINIVDYARIDSLNEFKFRLLKKYLNITNKEYIDFDNNFYVINPFKLDYEYQYSWFSEFGDLILPIWKQDFSRIDEGPYEYGNVNLKKNDVVIDAGANIGIFSNYAASKGCKVVAFEPIEKNMEVLYRNTKIYNSIIKSDYALSNCNEILDFYMNEINTSCGMKNNFTDNSIVKVKSISLDKYVEINNLKRVDFIKADIEGAERLMLQGAEKTIRRYRPKIAICTYHIEDDPQILEDMIKNYNEDYIIIHKWKKLFAYVPSSYK